MKTHPHRRWPSPPLVALPALAQGQLTVINFGGANGKAQQKAFIEPFDKASGTKVQQVEYNGEQAKIKAMVETKNVSWDVVEVESPDVARGCDEGLFERIDWAKIGNKADFQPAAVHRMRRRHLRLVDRAWPTTPTSSRPAPTTWADFWDVKKFPGKRGLRKGARYNLEFALMADGVKPADVYKVLATKEGADRAFKKLTELKPSIQWWEAGAQPPQFLVAGDVVDDHRLQRPHRRRPARRPQPEDRLDRRHLRPRLLDHRQGLAEQGRGDEVHRLRLAPPTRRPSTRATSAYGPTNNKALAKLDAKVLASLPTSPANSKDALQFNIKFWADAGEALEKRFASWAAQ